MTGSAGCPASGVTGWHPKRRILLAQLASHRLSPAAQQAAVFRSAAMRRADGSR
ncbi:hypothetical protein [Arthrobacter sp. B3I4]|uniref:hypothetical protein n=1 Tax=Arthrobacter sp. B3I4 TaxID=3042267 RepID=UPI00277E2BB0|nr:hypothetical protein [Arthrobacter sp. B3I4]MDQ0755033.1 hypothetical protein [Arthrobacter sp. B3I4]